MRIWHIILLFVRIFRNNDAVVTSTRRVEITRVETDDSVSTTLVETSDSDVEFD